MQDDSNMVRFILQTARLPTEIGLILRIRIDDVWTENVEIENELMRSLKSGIHSVIIAFTDSAVYYRAFDLDLNCSSVSVSIDAMSFTFATRLHTFLW